MSTMIDAAPFVSVIIPVFNDAARLNICLTALQQQTYPRKSFEIIVVDNGSSQNTRGVCEQQPGVRFEFEAKTGSYAARNRGIQVASGTVIAFTDADCIPHLNWIEMGVARLLEAENVGLLGGSIKVFPANNCSPTPVEIYEMVVAFPQQRFITESDFAATANVFTFRRILETVGTFESRLKSSGDLEWGRRVKAAGFALYFAPDVVVAHPARRTLFQLLRKARRIEGGQHDLRALKRFPKLKDYLFALLTTWPSAKGCHEKLRLLESAGPGQILLFYSIMLIDRAARFVECFRLLFWGQSHRE